MASPIDKVIYSRPSPGGHRDHNWTGPYTGTVSGSHAFQGAVSTTFQITIKSSGLMYILAMAPDYHNRVVSSGSTPNAEPTGDIMQSDDVDEIVEELVASPEVDTYDTLAFYYV